MAQGDPAQVAPRCDREPPAEARGPRWPLLATEIPWILASAASIGVIAWRTRQDVKVALNGGWREYLQWVDLFRDPERVAVLNAWREPTWAWIVAVWGNLTGQPTWAAAFDIAHASVALTLFCAALLARALGGRVAATFVGVVALGFPLLAQGWLWLDPYPAVGAAVALSLALGACAARWGHPAAALGAAGAAGLAFALDGRALGAAPSALLLVALAPWRGRPARRAALLGLCLACLLAAPLAERRLLRRWCLPQTPAIEEIAIQHGHGGRGAVAPAPGADFTDPAVVRGTLRMLAAEAFSAPGRDQLALNLGARSFGLQRPPGVCLLPLLLLPARGRGWRSSLTCVAAFLPCAAVFLLAATLVGIFPRYTSVLWALALAAVPVALGRLATWVPFAGATRRWARPALCAALLAAWVLLGWPGAGALVAAPNLTPHTVDAAPSFAVAGALAGLARAGDHVLDCSPTSASGLVPADVTFTSDPGLKPAAARWWRCEAGSVLAPTQRLHAERLRACAEHASGPGSATAEWLLTSEGLTPEHAVLETALEDALVRGRWHPVPIDGGAGNHLWTRPAGR